MVPMALRASLTDTVHMLGCFVCMHGLCSDYRGRKRASDSLQTGVIKICQLPRGWWEWNLGPLEKQPALLTTEPSQGSPSSIS